MKLTDRERKELAEQNCIARALVGSQAYGTNVGRSMDRDEIAVFVETPEQVCGMNRMDSVVHRDAGEGNRSQPGDLDLTYYSLRKFVSLAYNGNPQILEFLWLPGYLKMTPHGRRLIAMRSAFYSKEAGKRYQGYLKGQLDKMLGNKAHNVKRTDLVEKHGYDTKFAMHALRIGLMGVEYMTTGFITLPIDDPSQSELKMVRNGLMKESDVLDRIHQVDEQLRAAVDSCRVETPDTAIIDMFLATEHTSYWKEKGLI